MNKKLILPAVLALSLSMVFAQAAGYYFSKSLGLLSLSLLIFSFAFKAIMQIAKNLSGDMPKHEALELAKSQSKSVLLNALLIMSISIFIIIKAAFALSNPKIFDFDAAYKFSLAGFILFSVILAALFWGRKMRLNLKPLFSSCLIVLGACSVMIVEIIFYRGDFYKADIYFGIFLALIIITQGIILIANTIRRL
jgi:Co/Zn/Cd efflux system component